MFEWNIGGKSRGGDLKTKNICYINYVKTITVNRKKQRKEEKMEGKKEGR